MFEDLQNQGQKKPDEWFYPTVAFAVATVVIVTIFTLDFSGLISLSERFTDGMKIEGEMSVAGASSDQAAKLGRIKVCLVPEDKILEWINIKNEKAIIDSQKAKRNLDFARYSKSKLERDYQSTQSSEERTQVQSLRAKLAGEFEKAEADYRYWSSPAYYFSGLKDCAAQAVTDSEGRFSLNAKPGRYALAAEAGREVTNLKENYFWLLWVTPETAREPVKLDNENLMTANPPEKVMEIKVL